MGVAVGHALKNWDALTVVHDDANVPLGNSLSERALNVIVRRRKDFSLFGHE
ncbi:Hypothetical protein A7982_01279 [Minicystis rosea]|nr:Hypothetical protein A7982_01279 [Minicystis rosea]